VHAVRRHGGKTFFRCGPGANGRLQEEPSLSTTELMPMIAHYDA
jgi:hypothetical protein